MTDKTACLDYKQKKGLETKTDGRTDRLTDWQIVTWKVTLTMNQPVQWLSYGLDDQGSICGKGNKRMFFLFATASRAEVRPTQPPIQWESGVQRPGVKLTTHLHLVPTLWMHGATTPVPQYIFKAWCLIKHKENYLPFYIHTGLCNTDDGQRLSKSFHKVVYYLDKLITILVTEMCNLSLLAITLSIIGRCIYKWQNINTIHRQLTVFGYRSYYNSASGTGGHFVKLQERSHFKQRFSNRNSAHSVVSVSMSSFSWTWRRKIKVQSTETHTKTLALEKFDEKNSLCWFLWVKRKKIEDETCYNHHARKKSRNVFWVGNTYNWVLQANPSRSFPLKWRSGIRTHITQTNERSFWLFADPSWIGSWHIWEF
jgi:hypothetical protein